MEFCCRVRKEIEVDAGVSRGKAFCGVLGKRERCEYVALGGKVNLAARLMGVAMKVRPDQIESASAGFPPF